MNSSKKEIKGPKKESKFKKEVKNPVLWIVICAVLVAALIGGVAFDQLYKRVVLTVSGDKFNMADLSYYFYQTESQYDYINQLYGGTYWDQTNDSGVSNREAAKQQALASALYTEVMYKDALANNYSLTDNEKKTVATDVSSFLDSAANKKAIKKNHYTKKYLTNIMGKAALVARYRKDIVDKLDIDDDAIKKTINYDDYRRYDFEYLYISGKKTDDDSGKEVDLTDTEKAAAFDKINSYYETAKTSNDWSKLLPDTEKDVQYVKNNFNSKSTNFDEDFRTKVMAMDNDEVSDVFESGGSYYIIRMIDNNSSEDYDSAVSQAISNAEDEAFSPKYQEIAAKYKIKFNEKELNKYTMGEITLP